MAKKQTKKELIPKKISFKEKIIKLPLVWFILIILAILAIGIISGVVVTKAKSKISDKVQNNLSTKNIFSANKVDKPELDFYVMSFCPYGNQMETTLRPVFDLLKDKANLQPRYIFEKIEGDLATYCKKQYTVPYDPNKCADYVTQSNGQLKDVADCKKQIATMVTQAAIQEKQCNNESSYLKIGNNLYTSLHGRVEANQDVREICAFNLTDDKKLWWDFVGNINTNCTAQNADTCWEDQAKKAGLDTNKITECFNKDAQTIIEKEIAATTKFKVQGSPTLILGDKNFPPESSDTSDQNFKIGNSVFTLAQARTPDIIKQAICSAFKKSPKECNTTLNDSGSNTATDTGNCN